MFVVSSFAPLSFGTDIEAKEQLVIEDYSRYLYPEFYDCYSVDEIPSFVEQPSMDEYQDNEVSESQDIVNLEEPSQPLDDPMDSPWPMHGHDTCHTGLSPYSTAGNLGEEKWWYKVENCFVEGSPVIDNDGVIYFGSWDNYLYAMYPNGTLKWTYEIGGNVETSPAIAEDGTIYVGTHWAPGYGTYLYAINPDGTLKWKYETEDMLTSPAIGDDGTIYVSDGDNSVIALNPNGTLKWSYTTGDAVLSSPAIDENGIVYFGSIDDHVYALYPNGTLKWKFNTGSWVHGCPTIADDGTVYIGSDNGYLYALNPSDGSVIWQCYVGAIWGSPALDAAGNLYVGVWEKNFYSINPNGEIRWNITLNRRVWGMSAAVSKDGAVYFGTCDFEGHDGGPFYIMNPDGTIKKILDHVGMFWSSPAIGSDGTVYICTRKGQENKGRSTDSGYLRALNKLDPDAPISPVISGPTEGKIYQLYNFTFYTTSPLGKDIYYWVEWDDLAITYWIGPYNSGEKITLNHIWDEKGRYNIIIKAKDTDNLWGPWGEFELTIKEKSRAIHSSLFLQFLDGFPLLQKVLLYLIK